MIASDNLLNLQILYVEDEDETRNALYEVLKRRAGKVYVGKDGLEGLELYKNYSPDIVIADLFMPNMGGLEMIQKIKETGAEPDVIIISALNDVEVVLNAVDLGIVKYILKPIDVNQLLTALSKIAEKRTAVRAGDFLIENKKQIEDSIKKEFAAFLKTTTGKGPRDVKVFIHDSSVEITAVDVFTCLEKSILDNGQNIAIIREYRGLFYSIKEKHMCQLISSLLGREVSFDKVSVDTDKNINRLVFTIER